MNLSLINSVRITDKQLLYLTFLRVKDTHMKFRHYRQSRTLRNLDDTKYFYHIGE